MKTVELDLVLACFGATLLFLELASGTLKTRLYLSSPIVATLAGVLFGPYALNLLGVHDNTSGRALLESIARITLAITIIGVALRLPERFIVGHWRSLLLLLGVLMPIMCLISGLIVWGTLDISFGAAMLIGAALSPTDPVVASTIVTGRLAEKHIPERVRHLMSAESGANDALAYPFVMAAGLFLAGSQGSVVEKLLVDVLLWQVLAAAVAGAMLGFIVGRVALWEQTATGADRISLLGLAITLALSLVGAVHLMQSNGLLAAFFSGVVLNVVIQGNEQEQEEHVQEVLKKLIDIPVFVLFGMLLPFDAWVRLGWPAVVLCVLVLVLRRLPGAWLLSRHVKELRPRANWLFFGWFGPIGVAAVFYATMVQNMHETSAPVWPVVSLVVCASILVHGVSSTPFVKYYGRINGAGGPSHEST